MIRIILLSFAIIVSMSLFNSALSDDGEKVFKKKCKSCHSLTKKKMGPPLGDIWDKKAGSQKGYRYSKAMKRSKVIWTDETLDSFLANPKKYIKGTKMKIRGLKPNHRSAIIEYLKPDSEEEDDC